MPDMLGFFELLKTADEKGYIGALLVTDRAGKPEEFRVTYPTKPTAVQRHLYGASLEPHVGVVLSAVPLYQELKTRQELSLIVLRSPLFLDLGTRVPCHVVSLERVGEKLSVVSGDTRAQDIKISSRVGTFAPVRPVFPQNYTAERCQQVVSLVQECFDTLDLLEPFERIRLAVASLSASAPKFQ